MSHTESTESLTTLSDLPSELEFQFWAYRVSHGEALIRSPPTTAHPTTVDLHFLGVEYLALPRHLGPLQLAEPTEEETERCKRLLGTRWGPSCRLFVLEGRERHLVVAAHLRITEHQHDLFWSPFETLAP